MDLFLEMQHGICNTLIEGKQNGIVFKDLYLIFKSAMKTHLHLQNI
jgi:hypothetical protein